jgi:hypothetical protein
VEGGRHPLPLESGRFRLRHTSLFFLVEEYKVKFNVVEGFSGNFESFHSLSLCGSSSEASKSREAGTGIEPVNSGFADRGLTTWLPRRIRLSEPIRWLSTVLTLSLAANCCQFSKTKRMSAYFRPTNAHHPVQRKQGVQVLSGWLQSQWQAKAAFL